MYVCQAHISFTLFTQINSLKSRTFLFSLSFGAQCVVSQFIYRTLHRQQNRTIGQIATIIIMIRKTRHTLVMVFRMKHLYLGLVSYPHKLCRRFVEMNGISFTWQCINYFCFISKSNSNYLSRINRINVWVHHRFSKLEVLRTEAWNESNKKKNTANTMRNDPYKNM